MHVMVSPSNHGMQNCRPSTSSGGQFCVRLLVVKYLLVGNYGVGNLGDEALREYFLETYPEVEWVVVMGGAKGAKGTKGAKVCRLPFGLRSLFMTPWWRTIRSLQGSDGIVFGGGSLFTDTESSFACWLWWWHACVGWLFRKDLILAFQGIGPFRTGIGKALAKWVVKRAVFVSVRDQASLDRITSWRSDVILSFDPILKAPKVLRVPKAPRSLLVIPRRNSDRKFFSRQKHTERHTY